MPTGPADEAALVRSFLAERDAPCPRCGYNLRGLAGTSCPECEAGVSLGVDGAWAPPRTRTEAVALLWVVVITTGAGAVAQVAIVLSVMGAVPGLGWWLPVQAAQIGFAGANCVVASRLVWLLRPSGIARRRSLVVRWALIWLWCLAANGVTTLAYLGWMAATWVLA